MTNPTPSGDISVQRDLKARNVVTGGIQQNFNIIFQQPFEPPPDLRQLRADYLAYLRQCYRYLDMKGIMQVQQITRQLALTDIYVPLKAYTQVRVDRRVAGRWRQLNTTGPAELSEAMAASGSSEPQLVEEALKTDPAVGVLGDPGAGKSTLLKVSTLARAGHEDGPRPLTFPPYGFGRRWQQGQVSLGQFLGEYYAARQQKLRQVGRLFEAALAGEQAVVLLDGLDEVQADRQYLVRLVQDFAAERIPQPAAGGQPPAVVKGNRIVVSSRIVGYEEAPSAGAQWRTDTLTDRNRVAV